MQEVVPVARKRTYNTVPIQQVDPRKVAAEIGQRCVVAVDVAKTKMFVGFANAAGKCVQIVRFEHPTQTRMFLALLTALRDMGVALELVMEPTGVYGDALRHQVIALGVPVFRMDAKKVHDAAELLDGVPSLHDAKACTILAHLHAQGLSKPWRERTDIERALRSLIDERDIFARPFEAACGRLEAVVARYWPELSEHIDVQRSWHLHLLSELPSPRDVAARPASAAELLRRVTRSMLAKERIERIVGSAADSLGHPMNDHERTFVRALAGQMLELRARIREIERRIAAVLAGHRDLDSLVDAFGAVTTAAVIADVGNPATYGSTGAFEKALGLNLKIRSSGENGGEGTLHITKRGPGRARRYLFLAALRLIASSDVVKRWYQARASYRSEIKLKAVVALMRKLACAMVHVARGAPFDATKLFDVRRLVTSGETPTSPAVF